MMEKDSKAFVGSTSAFWETKHAKIWKFKYATNSLSHL